MVNIQKRNIRAIVYVLIALFFSGCSSYFKRKDCEKTNWHEHGRKVAMGGQRLDSDHFVKTCEKVEAKIDYAALDIGFKAGMANYCLPKTVYSTGKNGQRFNPKMCDGSNLDVLAAEHKKGVEVYCQPNNAYRVASKGGRYNGICPQDLESAFLKSFDSGRQVFLKGQIKLMKQQLQDRDRRVNDSEKTIARFNAQLRKIPFIAEPSRSPNQKEDELTPEQRSMLRQRRDLARRIDQSERKINSYRQEQDRLRQEISKYEAELMALEGNKK